MLLARRGQFHHSRLAETVDAFSPGGMGAATRAGAMRLDEMIRAQAALVSYVEIFWLLAIIAALAVPLMLMLLRRIKPEAATMAH
jgi:DHA2 family multidrug resistance protein